MGDRIRTYRFGSYSVQSYLDEEKTLRLFQHALGNKLLGRTAPPRKGFLGMASRMLWTRRFVFEGAEFVVTGGGGREIAIFEAGDSEPEESDAADAPECRICGMPHPESDLVATPEGPVCEPCYAARFPVCTECGRRVELADDEIPAAEPFVCRSCGG